MRSFREPDPAAHECFRRSRTQICRMESGDLRERPVADLLKGLEQDLR